MGGWEKSLLRSNAAEGSSNPKVLWLQGNHDAWLEGGQLPLVFPFYVPKEASQPPSCVTLPGRPTTHCVLPPEVAKIPAKISNQKVLGLQGNHDAWPEGG